MRPFSLLVSLLLLHLLLSRSHGARLGKFSTTKSATPTTHHQHTNLEDNNNEAMEIMVEIVCKDEDHCIPKGNNRKLITSTTIMSSTSTAKPTTKENVGNPLSTVERPSSSVIEHEHRPEVVSPEKYEDLSHMSEMDYSSAQRKSPIHN